MSKNTSKTARSVDSQGRRSGGSIARTRTVIAIVGNLVGALALVVAAGAIYWLLALTASDRSISSVFEDDIAGTETMAFPFLMLALSMVGFFFGQFAVRGRWDLGSRFSKNASKNGTFQVTLRPVSVTLHSVFLGAALLAWVAVVVVPVYLDTQGKIAASDGSSAVEQFWFTVTIYAVVSGVVAAIVGVSLLKKLTYNRSLARSGSTVIEGSPQQRTWRKFSHIYRGELGIAGFAGAALGLSPLGIRLDSALYGFGMLAAGLILLAAAIALALGSWRSGLPVERVESYT
jgi:uncharacterized membrane protein